MHIHNALLKEQKYLTLAELTVSISF